MLKICFFVLCSLALSASVSIGKQSADEKPVAGSTTYDQRQTGKYNVHVNIKDVQFFSLSDSIGSVGDYSDYGDYGDFGETDSDYDTSHLTVNPVFAFLGSNKPTTTPKPATTSTTEKLQSPSSNSPSVSLTPQESSLGPIKESTTSGDQINAQESDAKDPSVEIIKPVETKKPPPANDTTIDYEEIPVEVQYYRTNHQKLPSSGRRDAMYKRQPSVQIIDGHGRANNVKIVENDQHTVKICNRGEFRDGLGRCRIRSRRGVGAPGLRRLFNLFSSYKMSTRRN